MDEPAAARARLSQRWADLMTAPGMPAVSDHTATVGARLVSAYADDRRGYHGLAHLAEVLDQVDALAASARDVAAVRLAAWFHDAVYEAAGAAGADEQASAALAERLLPDLGLPRATVATVARLVRLTATHDPAAGDADGAVLCDADLAVLARDPSGYAEYVAGVRREYAQVPDEVFRAGRAAVLRSLLDRPRLFRTDAGHGRWEAAARRNITAELAELTGG